MSQARLFEGRLCGASGGMISKMIGSGAFGVSSLAMRRLETAEAVGQLP